MSKGFLLIAQNTDSVNYVRQAYALALSIKATQKTVTAVSLVTDDMVPEGYKHVFDHIVSIPFGDQAKDSAWKVENRWKLYHASPYEETIVLDTDMLFLDDVTQWWKYLSNHELKFCSKVCNYKSEVFELDPYHRKAFNSNQLPNPYFALHYFKKSELAHTFYKTLEFVVNNWELCYGKFAPVDYQDWLSMDLASAIAIDMMGLNEVAVDVNSPLVFVHMKPLLQNWNLAPAKWQDTVHYHFNKRGDFFVANIKQTGLFHYVEKDFLTDDVISRIEDLANG